MSTLKKALALILSIVMLFTMMPATIFSFGAEETYPVMEAYNAASSGDYHKYYNKVYSVTFLDKIDTVAIDGAIASWDVSAAKDGSVMAWMYLNEEATATAGTDRYDVYIAGEGGVGANPNSSYIFYSFSALKEINGLENFKTENATTFYQLFGLCKSLKSANLSSFNTNNVQNLSYLFYQCESLESVNFSDWNTSNVTNMSNMFYNCNKLTVLDLSSFDTSKVTTMKFMFYLCKELLYIYAGDGWTTKSIANLYDGVFNCCYAKFGGQEEYEKNPNPPVSGLYAGFEEDGGYLTKAYNVRYEFKGDVVPNGETAPEKVLYEAGKSVVVEENPSHIGYIFSGWETTDADISTGTFEIENDVLIVGEWTKITAENIEVEQDAFELKPGETDKINVTVKPDGLTENGVIFESSDESVVKVDEDGNITAIGEGTAVIKITSKDNEVVYVEVGVTVAYETYDVTYEFIGEVVPNGVAAPTKVTYKEGTTVYIADDISAEGYEFSGWSTTDATVDSGNFVINSDVHFVGSWTKLYKVEYRYTEGFDVPEGAPDLPDAVYYKPGELVDVNGIPYVYRYLFVGWTTEDADVAGAMFEMPENDVVLYGYFKIPVESIEIMGEDVTINKDGTTRLNIYVKPEDATIKDIVYESSDESVATVDKYGNIKAVGEGTAIITVKSKDDSTKSDTVTVTVKIPVTEMNVDKTEITLREDGKDKITVTVNPDATNKEVTFKSSDETVVKVDKDGNIEAVGDGEAIITVTSNDNPNLKEEINVTVKNPVTEITVPEDEITIYVDDITSLDAKANEDATNKKLLYESSDPGVVKVDNEGNIIGVGEGTTTITITSADNPTITETVTVNVVRREYKVTYEFIGDIIPEGVAAPTEETYKEGSTVTVEADSSAEGYIFSGWSTDDTTVAYGEFTIYNDVHFVGSWKKITHDVTYEFIGEVIPEGATAPDGATYDHGATVTVEGNPSAEGYIFSGWSTTDTTVADGEFTIYNDVHFVGSWKKITHDVTYEFIGEVIPEGATAPNDATYDHGATVTVEGNPSAEGYIFSGWSTDDVTISDGKFTINNDVHFVGSWEKITHDVTYEFIGEVIPEGVTAPSDATYDHGATVTVEGNPSAEGYIFSGWSTTDTIVADGEFTIYNDVHFVGSWEKITHDVTYEFIGEVIPEGATAPEGATYDHGATVTVEGNPSAEGYIFSGWSTDDVTVADGKFTINNDVHFVGSWEKIKIPVENITVDKTVIELETGKTDKITVTVTPNNATDKDVTFESADETVVKIDKNGNIEAVGEGTTTITVTSKDGSDKKVTIKVTVKNPIKYFNVTYGYTGNVPANAPAVPGKVTYEEGSGVTVAKTPSLDGYIFSGWTTTDAVVTDGKFVINNNVHFVGSWSKAPGPVTEVIAPDTVTIILGEEKPLGAHVNENAINKGLTYTSRDESIVKVDANGNITAVGEGMTTITVASVENPTIFVFVTIIVTKDPSSNSKHYIVFGKTEKIGWYSVSLDGGKTFFTQFGNDHLEVTKGTEIIVKANDVFGDPFTFYINGEAAKPDENGYVRILVDKFILIGALGIPVVAPDAEESLNFIQQLIKLIKDFFAKIASWFKFR